MPRKVSRKKQPMKAAPRVSKSSVPEQDLTVLYVAGGLLVLLVLADYMALL